MKKKKRKKKGFVISKKCKKKTKVGITIHRDYSARSIKELFLKHELFSKVKIINRTKN